MPPIADYVVWLLVLLLAMLGILFSLSVSEGQQDRIARRARELAAGSGGGAANGDEADLSWRARVMSSLSGVADHIPLFQGQQREKLQKQLVMAGYRQSYHLSVFMVIKFVCGALCLVGAALGLRNVFASIPILHIGLICGGLLIGLLIPEMILDRLIKRRQKKLNRALPEALDLLVICTNAGYSLAASIQRVSNELVDVYPVMASELQTTAHEMQVMGDTVAVLRRLADRTDIAAIRSLVATLVQTQQYGTPITQSLRTLAQSERTARMMSMEERAAKLSVKITFPMMVFILPTVMIIAAGPAALKLIETFGK